MKIATMKVALSTVVHSLQAYKAEEIISIQNKIYPEFYSYSQPGNADQLRLLLQSDCN